MKKWNGKWIGFPICSADVAPVFKKVLPLQHSPKSAEVWISGLGTYVLRINGKRVEEDILQPAFSDYNKTVYYNCYDVTEYLQSGENVLQITLGNGWYNEQQATDWQFHTAPWKDFPRLIFELWEGETLLCCSDASWLCAESQTVFNSIRCGESYDATRQPVFSQHATVVPPPGGVLKEQKIQPIQLRDIYQPVEIITQARYWGSQSTQLIYDFGINLSGNAELTVRGKRGSKVQLKYFEKLLDNGLPETSQLTGGLHNLRDRDCFQREVYTLSGDGTETWHSEFCYHGFRYVAVLGDFEELSLQARCFHTNLSQIGDVETDNPLIRKLQSAVKRSTLTNFHHIPTDCPHREKLGWTADGWLSAEQALFNFDMVNAYSKWMADFADSQRNSGAIPCIVPATAWGHSFNCGPCWDLSLFEIPWQLYRYTGQRSCLEGIFQTQTNYFHYLPGILEDGLCRFGLADWLAPVNMGNLSPDEAVITLCCGRICQRFADISGLLGRNDLSQEALALRDQIRSSYIKKYADLDIPSQTVYAMELAFDFTDDRSATLQRLLAAVQKANYHINGGVLAAKYVLDVLTENGYFNLAYRIAMQTDYPGWGYMASINSGTLGEDWGGGKSGNHHFFSEIGAWYYKALAGIRIDDAAPGFRNLLIEPHIPTDIENFRAWRDTPYGRLEVSWDADWLYLILPTTADLAYHGKSVRLLPGSYQYKREDD